MSEEKENKGFEFNLKPGENEQYKPVKADLKCPKCGKTRTMTLRACVNVSLHPEEKDQILDGTFFQQPCPDCGESISVTYPLLYDDMSKALMVYLLPDETEKALAEMNAQQASWSDDMIKAAKACTMRGVRSINELCEKIKIADAGLDDRYVELTKAFVFAQFLKQKPEVVAVQVLYDRQDDEDGLVIVDKDGTMLWVVWPTGLYDEVINMFAERVEAEQTAAYELIDANWTMKILSAKP